MKMFIATILSSVALIGNAAHAACENKESKVVAVAKTIGVLNGFKKVELSSPLESRDGEYGKYTITISGERNGFYSQGTDYEIVISDDGFCSVVSVQRADSIE